MSSHHAVVEWRLDTATADGDYLAGHYSRAHAVTFDGGLTVPASASPVVVRRPWSREDAADPEEMLVASASSCHMLWFLDFARRAGLVVQRYRDAPEGVMGRMGDGSTGIVRIHLRPHVDFSGVAPSSEVIRTLHNQAHGACNIANSLKSDVLIEPVDQSVEE